MNVSHEIVVKDAFEQHGLELFQLDEVGDITNVVRSRTFVFISRRTMCRFIGNLIVKFRPQRCKRGAVNGPFVRARREDRDGVEPAGQIILAKRTEIRCLTVCGELAIWTLRAAIQGATTAK